MSLLTIISPVIAFGSLCISWYRDFLHKPKLKSNLRQIVFLPPFKDKHSDLSIELLADLIFNDSLPVQLRESLAQNADFRRIVKSIDKKENLIQEINDWIKLSSRVVNMTFPDQLIQKYINYEKLEIPIYLPLNIYNEGKATGELSEIFLILSNTDDPEKVVIYQAILAIKESEIIKHQFESPDWNYLDKLFPGVSIKPSDSVRCDLLFIKVNEIDKLKLRGSNLTPGEYDVYLVGYNSLNVRKLVSKSFKLLITEETIVRVFSGTKIVRASDNTEKCLSYELESSKPIYWHLINRQDKLVYKK